MNYYFFKIKKFSLLLSLLLCQLYGMEENSIAKKSKECINMHDDQGYTPLIMATKKRQGDIAKRLVASGADITGRHQKNGSLAIHFAAQNGDLDMLEWYVEKLQVRLDVYNNDRETPLDFAVTSAGELRAYAVKQEMKKHNKEGMFLSLTSFDDMTTSSHNKAQQCVEYILNRIIHEEWAQEYRNQALHTAIHGSCEKMTQVLLDHGADSNSVNCANMPLLHVAINKAIDNRYSVLVLDEDAASPSSALIPYIMREQATLSCKNNEKIVRSMENETYLTIIKILLENGADCNSQHNEQSALHSAMQADYRDLINLLLDFCN